VPSPTKLSKYDWWSQNWDVGLHITQSLSPSALKTTYMTTLFGGLCTKKMGLEVQVGFNKNRNRTQA